MVALAEVAMDELDAAVEAAVSEATSNAEGLRLSLAAMLPLGNRQLFLSEEPLDHVPEIKARWEADREEMVAAIKGAQAEGAFDRTVPPEWIAASYDAVLYAGWEAIRDGDLTARQAADLAWRTLTTGLGPTA